ncbi:hypothetical protein R54767_05024 [Paraburkholderia gardini]|uniref:Uncharacterized protein n=1 Tax=Paraburkholderia gardini TaxID=2823469 RepID=A0ABM8UAN2_9BURK|nr:hypothetical protein R54767_05024 [Paraburkholderia gardini]
MRIRTPHLLRWTANTYRAISVAGQTLVRRLPGHLMIFIDLYSVRDLSNPRR